jgi:hypothetical protein
MPKITKQFVSALKPPLDPRGPATTLTWDNELRGFCVAVGRSGAKSFVVQYRNSGGR